MTLSVLVLLVATGQVDPKGAVPPSVDPAGSCATCHADVVAARKGGKDTHADFPCADCHPGRRFNPHAAPEVPERDLVEARALAPAGVRSIAVYSSCSNCHYDEVAALKASVHGQKEGGAHNEVKPSCQSCHGSIHAVTKESQTKLAITERCIACHGFAQAGKVPTSPHVADTYRDTIHGKMLRLGNERAASCADCHGSHDVLAGSDPRSSVGAELRPKTCQKCHENATASFAASISHEPHRADADFWGWLTALGFGLLTAGVIFLLFVHVILDFVKAGHRALRGHEPEHHHEGPAAADDQVPRFDIHMRIQHWAMMGSIIVLVFTGWPLKNASVGPSATLAAALGGQAVLAVVHRVAAAVLLLDSVYHLVYLVVRLRQGRLSLGMVPGLKDISDAVGNVAYFLGLRKERPRFGRWTYYEKFDYWAVFWGMFMMGGSGLVLWFPVLASNLVPGKLIAISHMVHTDEALVCALALFLWHFYNVHLKPTIFPMSWVWLTGKISVEALYEEHRDEYEKQYGSLPPKAAKHPSTWHAHHGWSVAGVLILVFAGVGVILFDVRSVREQIVALSAGVEPIEATAVPDPTLVKVASAFDTNFDVFGRCFECHNKPRFEQGGAGFPHRRHFEDNGVDRDCKKCHAAQWHKSMEVKTDVCLECHEPAAIGLHAEKK